MKIVIPGGSGQVGTILARAFHQDGHEVVVLSRSPGAAPWRTALWDARTPGDWVPRIRFHPNSIDGSAAAPRPEHPARFG